MARETSRIALESSRHGSAGHGKQVQLCRVRKWQAKGSRRGWAGQERGIENRYKSIYTVLKKKKNKKKCHLLLYCLSLNAGRERQAVEQAALELLKHAAGSDLPASSGMAGLGKCRNQWNSMEPEASPSGAITAVKAVPSLETFQPFPNISSNRFVQGSM